METRLGKTKKWRTREGKKEERKEWRKEGKKGATFKCIGNHDITEALQKSWLPFFSIYLQCFKCICNTANPYATLQTHLHHRKHITQTYANSDHTFGHTFGQGNGCFLKNVPENGLTKSLAVFFNWKSKYFSGELMFWKLENVSQEITKYFWKNKIFPFYMQFDAIILADPKNPWICPIGLAVAPDMRWGLL